MPRRHAPAIVYTLQPLDAVVVQEGRAATLWALVASNARDRSVLRVDLAESVALLIESAGLRRQLAKAPALVAPRPTPAVKVKPSRPARKAPGAAP